MNSLKKLFKHKKPETKLQKYCEHVLPCADAAISKIELSRALLEHNKSERALYFMQRARENLTSARPTREMRGTELETIWQGAVEIYNEQARSYQQKGLQAELIEV